MTQRQRSETETRLEGFELRLHEGFAWANDHAREIVVGAVMLLVVGGILSAIIEYRGRQTEGAETALAEIETHFVTAMGSNPGEFFVAEPANAQQATQAREAALAEFDAFIAGHAGSPLVAVAGIKAAEMEVDLGKLDAADARLAKLADSLKGDDPRRAIALRLRGYTLEQRGQELPAAEAYEAAAKVESYPPRALAWISAGDSYGRANQPERAIAAYREALSASPEAGEQEHLMQRIGLEQAKLDAARPATPAPTPTPAPAPAPAN
ncbi:MAG TPA: tetratricopeptide repeat protein [Myxococcota bacterium]|nr:tetratricopeptide repeat protein [Myxococcota bacterium]